MKRQNILFKTFGRLMIYLTVAAALTASAISCGFQLNFNRRQLPAGASSISIKEIHNSTFVPGADIWLKKLLTEEFLQHSLNMADPNSADLVLSFKITDANISKGFYSWDKNIQVNEFLFSISGQLSVINNIKRSLHIDSLFISASHSIKAKVQDLSPMRIEEGRHKALVDLKEKIFSSLTQEF